MSYFVHLMKILDPTGKLPIGLYGGEDGNADYDKLVWESETVRKPTKEEFDSAVLQAKGMMYKDERRSAYPSIGEQLDVLFHEGYDGWKATIQAIKDEYPKPEAGM